MSMRRHQLLPGSHPRFGIADVVLTPLPKEQLAFKKDCKHKLLREGEKLNYS